MTFLAEFWYIFKVMKVNKPDRSSIMVVIFPVMMSFSDKSFMSSDFIQLFFPDLGLILNYYPID